jgi:hypothetical protein
MENQMHKVSHVRYQHSIALRVTFAPINFFYFNPYPQKHPNDIGLFIIIEEIVDRP